MNNNMRRKDRLVSESEALAILQNGEFGILSMCTSNHEGYGIPVNYVVLNNAVYIHCAREGSKIDNVRVNPKASFCVVGKTEVLPSKFGTLYESAIVKGEVSEIEGDEKQEALWGFIEKYSADFSEEGKNYIQKMFERVAVLKLTIASITGKARKQ